MNSDIERVILDYLCLSNYTASAAMFAKETHLTPEVADLESLPRASIKHAILRGDIAEAILEINEIDPEVSFFLSCFASHLFRPPPDWPMARGENKSSRDIQRFFCVMMRNVHAPLLKILVGKKRNKLPNFLNSKKISLLMASFFVFVFIKC